MTTSPDAHVISHLQHLHAAERAQVGALRILRDEAQLPAVAALLDQHLSATIDQGDLLEARLEELGAGPSLIQLAESFGPAMVKGAIDRLRPSSACVVLRDAIVAEAQEVASYLELEQDAIRSGDSSTAVVAAEIRAAEQATLDSLRGFWHQAVQRDIDESSDWSPHVAREQLVQLLQQAHTIEWSAVTSLASAQPGAPNDTAAARVADHRHSSKRQAQDIAVRLRELGSRPQRLPMLQNSLFALMAAPLNIVRNVPLERIFHTMYSMEHLELVTYEQISALAEAAGDEETQALAERNLPEELAMIDWLQREAATFSGGGVKLQT